MTAELLGQQAINTAQAKSIHHLLLRFSTRLHRNAHIARAVKQLAPAECAPCCRWSAVSHAQRTGAAGTTTRSTAWRRHSRARTHATPCASTGMLARHARRTQCHGQHEHWLSGRRRMSAGNHAATHRRASLHTHARACRAALAARANSTQTGKPCASRVKWQQCWGQARNEASWLMRHPTHVHCNTADSATDERGQRPTSLANNIMMLAFGQNASSRVACCCWTPLTSAATQPNSTHWCKSLNGSGLVCLTPINAAAHGLVLAPRDSHHTTLPQACDSPPVAHTHAPGPCATEAASTVQ